MSGNTELKPCPFCFGEDDSDDLTECFRHHVRTTIGWPAFGARPGPEMQMYEEGFKAGYRRCKADNEPELGEEDDEVTRLNKAINAAKQALEWIEDYALSYADLEEVAEKAGGAIRSIEEAAR